MVCHISVDESPGIFRAFAIFCVTIHVLGNHSTRMHERLAKMRVVTNEALISRNRKISHILFFVSLIGMAGGFFMTWTQPEASTNISCILLPLLLLTTLTSVRMANTWIREPRPIEVIEDSFKGLGQKYTLFNHLLPAPHVLIGPEGVFTLTPLWQEGHFEVNGAKWKGEGGLVRRLLGYLRQDTIGNPFQDAQFHAKEVQKLLDKIAPESSVTVQPLIIFTSPNATVDIEAPIMPVLYADSKRKPALRQYLRELDREDVATLSEDDMDQIDRMYGLLTRQELEGSDLEVDGQQIQETDNIPEDESRSGTVYVARMDQLYKIAVTYDPVEEVLAALTEETGKEIELIHTVDSASPEALRNQMQKRFTRKRQKEDWYGLGQKDLNWIRGISEDADDQA